MPHCKVTPNIFWRCIFKTRKDLREMEKEMKRKYEEAGMWLTRYGACGDALVILEDGGVEEHIIKDLEAYTEECRKKYDRIEGEADVLKDSLEQAEHFWTF